MIYGYARVSTDEQSVDAQVKQLRGAGAQKIFRETASGARTDRAGLRQVLGRLGKGDVLMVTRLDRLARSTRDLLNTLAAIAVREAGFRSLGDTWADTTTVVVVQTLEVEPIRGLEVALDHAASTAFQISGAVLYLTRSLSSLN